MTDWRDTLPPIPSERILDEVMREGELRKDRRRKRRRRLAAFGGLLVAAVTVAVVVGIGLTNDDEDQFASQPSAAQTTAAAETTSASRNTTVAGSEPTTIAAASGTTTPVSLAAPETTQVPTSDEIEISPAEIWEEPATGSACGPTTVEVTYRPENTTLQSAMVLLGDTGTVPPVEMTVADNRATATMGPYGPETLNGGTQRELTVTVRFVDVTGKSGLVRSTQKVILHDCTQ